MFIEGEKATWMAWVLRILKSLYANSSAAWRCHLQAIEGPTDNSECFISPSLSQAYLPCLVSWLWHSRWYLMPQPRGWWFFQSGFSQRSAYLLAISALNAVWTLSGYYSQTGFYHLPVVFQQKSISADLEGFLDNKNKFMQLMLYTREYKQAIEVAGALQIIDSF